jgi:hypothetical protein
MKTAPLATLFFLMTLFAGCSSSRVQMTEQSTKTAVDLKQGNYKMVKAGAMGTSYGFRLLGVLPFASPSYAAAREDLYSSVGGGVSVSGRSIALANQMEDRSVIYLVLFSIPKRTLTADVIEFK